MAIAFMGVAAVFLAAAEARAATTVATIGALRALPPPATAAVVGVACHTVPGDGGGGSFRFDVFSSAADDNGTVIAPAAGGRGRWLRVFTRDLSVRWFGARGDGRTYDTAAVQSAVNAVRAGETLHFPPGVYRIHADRGVQLKSDLRLDLGTATLAGANVDGARCRLLEIQGKKNVVISGGTLLGSRLGSPQWGVGILASDAESLFIENVQLRDFFFDGILLTGNRGCRYVFVRGTASLNNRRAGMSVVAASDVTVTGSTFEGTSGQSPQAGVNVEPNAGTSVARVRFEHCAFLRNAGIGLYVHRALGDAVSDVTIVRNVVKDNDQGIAVASVVRASVLDNEVSGHRGRAKSGIVVGGTTGVIRIADNDLVDNFRGILAADASVEILRNNVVGTGPIAGLGQGEDGDGIVCRGISAPEDETCVVASNTVRRSAGSGIQVLLMWKAVVAANVIDTTGQRGIHLRYARLGEVRDNTLSGASLESPGSHYVVDVAQDSDGNLITRNVIRVGSARGAIGVGSNCGSNRVYGNVVQP
ncbi:MAG TPA: right-handed parallel beta-helix repeat-containing protein [Gemmatimonadales bacterium]|nr:right-handed parallel beta-helix repeat-containing protein [Gemmatimonadales bacterium]